MALNLNEIFEMKKAGNVSGLVAALNDSNEHVRRNACYALSGCCDEEVANCLAELKFKDPSLAVRQAAARGHEMVVARLRART
jgi:HEAT repeat protein